MEIEDKEEGIINNIQMQSIVLFIPVIFFKYIY